MAEDYHHQILEFFPEGYVGTFIDIGMSHPITYNNTFLLEVAGWEGICIEPNENYCNMSKGIRKNVYNFACGNINKDDEDFTIVNISFGEEGAVSSLKVDPRLMESHKHLINHVKKAKVKVRTLDFILQDSEIKDLEYIDVVSIDTENTELDVLKGFDILRWKPRLMIIENNFNEPHIEEYLKCFNYVKVKRYQVNDFYIPVFDTTV
jgi:FkbM family methyltransferase